MTSSVNSDNERLLYGHRKALNLALDEGAIPSRFWRIFYPLYRVEVEGWQRPHTDFEPIEILIEQAIEKGGFNSVIRLGHFFQLETGFVEGLVHHLQAIGHIEKAWRSLCLTDLAKDSLNDGRCYHRLRTQQALYFDGFGNNDPLTRDHYRLTIYDDIPPDARGFTPLFPFGDWDPEALTRLMNNPHRRDFNIPDEIEEDTVYPLPGETVVYLPVFVIECRPQQNTSSPYFLVFSMVKGYRDKTLEASFKPKQGLSRAFSKRKKFNLSEAVADHMVWRGLRKQEWKFEPGGLMGPQVTIAAEQIVVDDQLSIGQNQTNALTIADVGQYIFVEDFECSYCIWVTCEKVEVREQAVVKRALDWLQGVYVTPETDEFIDGLKQMCHRLGLDSPPSLRKLLQEAQRQHLGRAISRLDLMVAD